jgi:uncharacterized DUF497 family protein
MTDKKYLFVQCTYAVTLPSFPLDSFPGILPNFVCSQRRKLILLLLSSHRLLNLSRGFKLIINDIIWKQRFVEKISLKHQVSIDEVEEVLSSHPFVCKVAKGHVDHENIYAAYSQIHNGRYLIVFFIHKKGNKALPISARDMDNKERRYYENQKKSKKKY